MFDVMSYVLKLNDLNAGAKINRLNLKKIRSDSESITNTNARQIQMRSSMHMISAFLVASWKKYGELPSQPHKA